MTINWALASLLFAVMLQTAMLGFFLGQLLQRVRSLGRSVDALNLHVQTLKAVEIDLSGIKARVEGLDRRLVNVEAQFS